MADVQQLVDMGFAAADAEVALRESAGHVEQALELLLTGTLPEESKPLEKDNSIGGFDANSPSEKNKFVGGTPSDWPELPKPSGYVKPETRPPGLDQGSLDSLEDNVPTPQMPRQPGLPCGLLNVGNTCYVNSLLQTLFHAEAFRTQILRFEHPPDGADQPEGESPSVEGLAARRRRQHSLQLVLELRRLFAYCLLSDRSCVSPAQLIAELVDQHGHKVSVGSQEDVSEFMLKFVDQLEEGFCKKGGVDAQKDEEPGNLLHSLLFGEQVQIFSYRESQDGSKGDAASPECSEKKDKDLVVSEEKSDFLQIFLDVNHKNLYDAWAAANQQDVDYTTPAGTKADGKTRVWIRKLPKLLFFQLQRVAFDPETKAQVKLDDEFDFDAIIYPDRFLQRNKEKVLEAEAKVKDLLRQQGEIEQAIKSFRQYPAEDSGEVSLVPVTRLLHGAASCLESNIAGDDASEASTLNPGRAAACAGATSGQEFLAELTDDTCSDYGSRAVRLLRSLAELCRSQEARLQSESQRIARELSEAYGSLQEEQYELFGIWVHQGQQAEARSGHYIAFLRDRDRWMRFSDSFASFVSWEEVRAAALGGDSSSKSRSSAYVLVYMASSLRTTAHEDKIPSELQLEIQADNKVLDEERGSWQEQVKSKDLRQHAQAVFQHYAGLVHRWEPKRTVGDAAGNPHEASHRKRLNDPALICLELFLYRSGGEQDVWHYLLKCSLDAQREIRAWQPEDEGRVLFFLAETLRSQSCYVKMLREKPVEVKAPNSLESDAFPAESSMRHKEYELDELDLPALHEKYKRVLVQAYVLDEALHLLKVEGGLALPCAVGLLSILWAAYNLDLDYRFRHNEVLLVLSALMFNTISCIEQSATQNFREICEYFYLVLTCVEWPKSWKAPLQSRIKAMFPQAQDVLDRELEAVQRARAEREGAHGVLPSITTADQKQLVLLWSLKQTDGKTVEDYKECPQPSESFFERHRSLWSWAMQNEKILAQDFVTLTNG